MTVQDDADVVVAVLEKDRDDQVTAAATALANLLHGTSRPVRIGSGSDDERADEVLVAIGTVGVAAAAMSARGECPLCWDVMTRAHVPLLVVPLGATRTMGRIGRVLLPMDGTTDTAAGVDRFVRSAVAGGAEVVAVHVFDAATIPGFWDSAAHSHAEWTREFARRNLPPGARLDLRRGRAADEVLAEADRDGFDLMVLGWGQDLGSGRASTVRRALTDGSVPVLLVERGPRDAPGKDPGSSGPGTNAEQERGPSSLLRHDPDG